MKAWIKSLLKPPVFDDVEITRSARFLYFILGTAIVFTILSVIGTAVSFQPLLFLLTLTFLFLELFPFYFVRRGSIRLASITLISVFWIFLTIYNYFSNGLLAPSFASYILITLAATLLLEIQIAAVFTALSILSGLGMLILGNRGGLPALMPFDDLSYQFWSYTIQLIVTLIFLSAADYTISAYLRRARKSELAYSENNQKLLRRTMQLQTAAEVGRAAAEVRNLETLLLKVTHLVSDSFGFYHVGIFLLDDQKEYAVLRAANSPGGQDMLKNAHRLRVGEQGIVGYVAATQEPRIALDVGEDAVYFNNPHLPETRSEMALPLNAGSQLLGILDVQSINPAAFGEQDIAALQVLADQVAMAIDNAYLFDQMQALLQNLENRVEVRTAQLHERNAEVEKAYQALQENQQKLLVSEKMASLGRLTAGIAHEMNTPLASVRASLAELGKLVEEYQASIGDDEVTPEDHEEIRSEMQQSIQIATRSMERAASFVQSIKLQTRDLSPHEKQRFNLVPVIQETLLLLRHQLRQEKCEVSFNPPQEAVELIGSPGRLSQVVTNLVTNAIDASRPNHGGTIYLKIDRDETANILIVADEGCGIPLENLSKIFDPMFTTKPFGEGTGLGLTIAHDIVTGEFGGTISVISHPNCGSTFTIRLPFLQEKNHGA